MAAKKKYTQEYLKKLGDELLTFIAYPKKLPGEEKTDIGNIWLKDFCIQNKFSSQRLTEFAKESEYFAECLLMAKDIQESKIVKLGLLGKSNQAFLIFTLKNVAKWRDYEKRDDKQSIEVPKNPEFKKMSNEQLIQYIGREIKKVK